MFNYFVVWFWCRKSLWGACRSCLFSNTFAHSQNWLNSNIIYNERKIICIRYDLTGW